MLKVYKSYKCYNCYKCKFCSIKGTNVTIVPFVSLNIFILKYYVGKLYFVRMVSELDSYDTAVPLMQECGFR